VVRALSSHRACAIALVSLLDLAACSEHGPSGPGTKPAFTGELVACVADLRGVTLSCDMSNTPVAGPRGSALSPDLIVGGQGTNVELTSANVTNNAATGIFQADVTVQNLMAQILGTPDGSAVTGVKVFFYSGPTVVSGSGSVSVANPDGVATFTGTFQPYFLYNQTLETGQRSAVKTWEWSVPSTVLQFAFQVLVAAATAPVTATSCLNQAGSTVTLTGVQTSEYQDPNLADGTKIDASAAQFTTGTRYPVRISGSNICVHGGEVIGQWPPATSWDFMFTTFGVLVDTGSNVTVENMRIFDYGNGVSFQQNAPNWTVRHSYFPYGRDGCVENDFQLSGTVDDVLMECYSPFAAEGGYPVDGSNNVQTIRNSLVHAQPMDGVFSGSVPGTVGIFEWGATSPQLALYHNVFRADQNSSEPYLAPPPGKLVDCFNNIMIWEGSGPFPETLPATFNGRPCFTLMTGQAGLDYWNGAVARWKANHPPALTDIAPPVVSLFSPGVVGSTTLSGTVSLTASAADDRAVVGVQFQLDGQNIGPELTTDSPPTKYTLAWDSTSMPNGTYTLTATARDAVGHTTTSAGVTVSVSN
jgi:hypothetical protein